jgi:hypothetical protein
MKKAALFLIFAGYFTAAFSYWPFGGLNGPIRYFAYACLFCPHIDTLWGTPASRFVRFTLVSGTINTAVFLAFGALALGASKVLRRVKSN